MALYTELRDLYTNDNLKNRLDVAITIEAHALAIDNASTAEQLAWASRALANPRGEAEKALRFVLAANRALTVAQILGADDAVLQSAVALVVPALVAAS